MLTCPMCKKRLPGLDRTCANCKTDVSLLISYVGGLQEGLAQARVLARAGQVGDAVFAYLQVLEIEPDNAEAQQQVGQVVAAVRQFDHSAPGRRWGRKLYRQKRFRRLLAENAQEDQGDWIGSFGWLLLVLIALFLGYALGSGFLTPGGKSASPGRSASP